MRRLEVINAAVEMSNLITQFENYFKTTNIHILMNPLYNLPDRKNVKAFKILADALQKKETALIGITGAGGAGKTTFAENIVKFFGTEQALTIDLDDYLLSRTERGKLEVTGYNPVANNLGLASKHIEQLLAGQRIAKPCYNHATGEILPEEEVEPKSLLVVEGVTTLYPELKMLHDISFFLDALEETQIKSRIQRDVNERGYTLDEALQLFAAIKPDYERFIKPTKEHANIVFQVDTNYIMHPKKVTL